MGLLRRLATTALAAAGLSTPVFAAPALWKVSDTDSAIYLFGSVHLFTREMDWRTPQFDDLLKSAEYVYFEVVMDVDAYATLTYITVTEGMLPAGESLSSMLTAYELARLASVATESGLDFASLDRMRPWLAALSLTEAAYPKASAGVELLIEGEVEKARKRGLETAAEQMGFFKDPPLEEQIDTLMSTVDGLRSGAFAGLDPLVDEGASGFKGRVDAWEIGDTDALKSALDSLVTPRDKASYARLIDDRNARWVAPLEKLLAENDESLVIVGAAHLVGEAGVPALLEGKGYTVERIDAPVASGSHIDAPRR